MDNAGITGDKTSDKSEQLPLIATESLSDRVPPEVIEFFGEDRVEYFEWLGLQLEKINQLRETQNPFDVYASGEADLSFFSKKDHQKIQALKDAREELNSNRPSKISDSFPVHSAIRNTEYLEAVYRVYAANNLENAVPSMKELGELCGQYEIGSGYTDLEQLIERITSVASSLPNAATMEAVKEIIDIGYTPLTLLISKEINIINPKELIKSPENT